MSFKSFLLKYNLTKKDVVVIAIIIIAFFTYVILMERKNDRKRTALSKSHRYTIAKTTGKVKNIRSAGPDLNYQFTVLGILYGGSQRFINDGKIQYQDGRYYLKFQPEDPTNNKILLQYPVPDSLIEIPDSGWVQLPSSKQ